MKKKAMLLLSTCIFFGSALNTFAFETIQPIENSQKQMILQLDSTQAWIDGQEHTLTAIPKVIEGRTYLPLRFTADMLLEASVAWEAEARKAVIEKDGVIVELTIGKNEAYVNGDQMLIENSPIIEDSLTYLPLRTTADLFGIDTAYDEVSKQITLTKTQTGDFEPPVRKPAIAKFSFSQAEYTAGQQVRAIDESFHESGLPITNRLWMINHDETKTNSKLENMFSKPRAGTYQVSLKVESGKDNWSEWETKQITIRPNEKPLITSLRPTKEVYAGGEPMDFTYTYDNETWEGIKNVRWTYRQAGEVLSKAVVEKPAHIFHQGRYIVSLQLQDDYGNWSDTQELTIEVSGESRQYELEYRFAKGTPGDIIDNFHNFNYLNYKTVMPYETTLTNGTLFVSNSPENVKSNGILYRDTVRGPGRILVHHHNSFTEEENIAEPKKVVLVAENTSSEPASFTISNRVEKGPSEDILFVGQQIVYDYLKGSEAKTYFLNPGEKMYLYDSGSKKWEKGQVVSAQMDFNVTGSITLTTAAVGRNSTIQEIGTLPLLERDVHPRGSFGKTNINQAIIASGDEPSKLILGAGAEEWFNGYDAITGEMVQNRGNFGVHHKIKITATDKDIGVLLNPRAGLFRGALKWGNEQPFLAPDKGYFMGHNSKGVMLGVVKAGETRTLEYSLPNGSASPVLLVMIPSDDWKQ